MYVVLVTKSIPMKIYTKSSSGKSYTKEGEMLIGKILLAVWLLLTPAEQSVRLETMATEFCEQQHCAEIKMTIVIGKENVYFLADCNKFFL